MILAAAWVWQLAATIVIETAILVALAGRRRRQMLIEGPLLQLLTHPLATWLTKTNTLNFWQAEVLVISVEAALLHYVCGFDRATAVILSLVANTVTIMIALTLSM